VAKKRLPPENTGKGTTGRFVPCPAMRWRHPRVRRAFEVKWSSKRRDGETKVCFYFACSECEPKCQVFLNDWAEHSGWTIPEAEAEGFVPKCTDERKVELLAELGLTMAAPPPPPPPPNWRPPMPPHRYGPIPKTTKGSKLAPRRPSPNQ